MIQYRERRGKKRKNREEIQVRNPSRRGIKIKSGVVVAPIVHHLMERERQVRAQEVLGDMAPCLRRTCSVIPEDLIKLAMEPGGVFKGQPGRSDLRNTNLIEGLVVRHGH